MKNHHTIPDTFGEMRLDRWLRKTFPHIPLSRLHRAIRTGDIRLNGKKASISARISPGDTVEVPFLQESGGLKPRRVDQPSLDILFEDDDLLVLNKPAGIAVQGMHKTSKISLLDHVRSHLKHQDAYLVHRLDLNTTGVMVVAKTHRAAKELSRQFKHRLVEKAYLAIVHGVPKKPTGTLNYRLKRRDGDKHQPGVHALGDSAETHYEVLDSNGSQSLLILRPKTGRMHQLRVHLSFFGCPILGDVRYGSRKQDSLLKVKKGQLLHAYSLKIQHPVNAQEMVFKAPVNKRFEECMQNLSLRLK